VERSRKRCILQGQRVLPPLYQPPGTSSVRLRVLIAVWPLMLAACGGSTPTQPSSASSASPQPSTAPGANVTTGRLVDALTAAGLADVSLRLGDGTSTTTDLSGCFALQSLHLGPLPAVLSRAGLIERQTTIRNPGPNAAISLIPDSFDMASFDQMFRPDSRLQRWTSAPSLVIQTRTLVLTSTADDEFIATGEELTRDEADRLVSDLTYGFSQLTADRLGGFASVTMERATEGSSVNVKRTGAIVVARHQGLTQATGYWGYGRWAISGDGEVVGGIVFLDRDFDKAQGQYCRSLRVHELGHSLGYHHVTLRSSVMNSGARIAPNEWDRQAILIAFQRPPGNRAPDVDPPQYSPDLRSQRGSATATWGPPIY